MSSTDLISTANYNTLSDSPISSMSLLMTATTDNSTNSATTNHPDNAPLSLAAAAGIAIAVIVLISGVLMCFYLQSRRQLCRYCLWLQKRRQTTTSFGQLANEDTASIDISEKNSKKIFSNGDQDGGNDVRSSARYQHVEDDYFYDEIFERSAFVDETTNRANKDLTILVDNDDMGDDSVPELVFKNNSLKFN